MEKILGRALFFEESRISQAPPPRVGYFPEKRDSKVRTPVPPFLTLDVDAAWERLESLIRALGARRLTVVRDCVVDMSTPRFYTGVRDGELVRHWLVEPPDPGLRREPPEGTPTVVNVGGGLADLIEPMAKAGGRTIPLRRLAGSDMIAERIDLPPEPTPDQLAYCFSMAEVFALLCKAGHADGQFMSPFDEVWLLVRDAAEARNAPPEVCDGFYDTARAHSKNLVRFFREVLGAMLGLTGEEPEHVFNVRELEPATEMLRRALRDGGGIPRWSELLDEAYREGGDPWQTVGDPKIARRISDRLHDKGIEPLGNQSVGDLVNAAGVAAPLRVLTEGSGSKVVVVDTAERIGRTVPRACEWAGEVQGFAPPLWGVAPFPVFHPGTPGFRTPFEGCTDTGDLEVTVHRPRGEERMGLRALLARVHPGPARE